MLASRTPVCVTQDQLVAAALRTPTVAADEAHDATGHTEELLVGIVHVYWRRRATAMLVGATTITNHKISRRIRRAVVCARADKARRAIRVLLHALVHSHSVIVPAPASILVALWRASLLCILLRRTVDGFVPGGTALTTATSLPFALSPFALSLRSHIAPPSAVRLDVVDSRREGAARRGRRIGGARNRRRRSS